MAAAEKLKTTVEELPESRVRVEAEVPAAEVARRLNEAAGRMGRDLRMPGFRQGKVPAPVVIQRIGRDAVLDEAVRGSLGRWYVDAIDAAGIHPVGEPDVDLGDLPAEGQPLTFTIEIGVRPTATLGDISTIEVPRREPEVDDAKIDEQVARLREQLGRLETVERAAAEGDYAVIDFKGSIEGEDGERDYFDGGEGRDHLLELGSGQFIPGFEEQLVGASAGEERVVEITFPEDYGSAPHLAGKPARFEVTVNEVKAKQLPELDDDFATEAGGFDSVAELREDIAKRLRETEERQIQAEFNEAALDAVVDKAQVEVPTSLVDARSRELFDQMLHSLSHRGINKDAYLRIAQKSEEELLEEARPDAEKALRREAVLAAVIEAESIELSDGDILDALQEPAAQQGVKPEKLRKQLERSGRLDELREDLAQHRAIELLVERATAIDPERAAAREKIILPGQ
ncbi:trigger factor [Baekduia soli]|uniref:Trigger factor n=1 Tax=Baekduia soli TaxID=496014 RepID=A0A5B8U965_9ACTN|nr:trigger factor [Baekduia soli]QEC49699.1 trigger factor [Baekduia soli]